MEAVHSISLTENHSFAQLYNCSSGLSFAAVEAGEMNGNRAAEQSPDLHHFLPTISEKDNVV
jgi:hypothetical protein